MKTITKSWKRIAIGLLMALVILPVVWYDRASAQGNEPVDPFAPYSYQFADKQDGNILKVSNTAVKQKMKPGYTKVEITLINGYKAKMYVKFRPDIEDAHFKALNEYRESLGLSKLKRNAQLDAHARQRAAEVAFVYEQNKQLTHTRPNGYTGAQITQSAGENILANFGGANNDGAEQQAEKMLDMYKNSPGHNKNMTQESEGWTRYAGIGVAEIDSMYDGLPTYFNTQSLGAAPDGSTELNFTPYDQVEGNAPWIDENPTSQKMSEQFRDINMPTLNYAVTSLDQLNETEKEFILSAVIGVNYNNNDFKRAVKEVVRFNNTTKELVLRFKDNSEGTYHAPKMEIVEKGMSQNVVVDPIFAGDQTIKGKLASGQEDTTKVEIILNENEDPVWASVNTDSADSFTFTYDIWSNDLMYAGRKVVIRTTEYRKNPVEQEVRVKLLMPEKTVVQDPSNLTEDEKLILETNIREKNTREDGQSLLAGEYMDTTFEITSDGTTKITYQNGYVETIPGTELVRSQNSHTVHSHTVRFIAKGGGGSMQDVPVDDGAIYTLPECAFTAPSGQKFKAWLVDGTEKGVGWSIIVRSDLNIEAVWEADTTTAKTKITEANFKVTDLETTYKKAEEQEPKFDERFTRDTDYTVSYAKKVESEGALGSNGKPLGAGTYTVTVTGKGNYTGVITKTFTIKKATQEAPTTVTASAGKLSGLTDKMEYSKGDNGPWTACPDGELPGLAADTYHVRFKATDNYLAGKELTVEVPASPGNEDPSQPGTQDPNEPGTEEPGTGGTTPSNPSTPSIPSIPSVPSVTTPSKPVTKIPEQKGTNYGYAVAPAGSVDSTTRVRITEKANGKRDVILVDGNGNQVYSDELMLVTIPAPKGLKGSYRVKVDGVYTTFELSEDGKYVTMPMVFSHDGKMSDKVTLGKDGVLVQGSKKALPGMYKLSVTNRGNGRYSVNLLDQNGKQTRSNGPVMVSIPAPQGVKDVYRVNVDGKWTTFEIKDGIVRFAMVF